MGAKKKDITRNGRNLKKRREKENKKWEKWKKRRENENKKWEK